MPAAPGPAADPDSDALVAPSPTKPNTPLAVLEAAGRLVDSRGSAHSDPPGCRVERRTENGNGTVPWHEPARVSWHIEAHDNPGPTTVDPRLWHAWFDGHTPEHLVTAFVTALADPAPLQRAMLDRTARYSVVQQPSPLPPQQTAAAHTTRINSLRAQARSAHRQQQTKPVPAPATTQPAARR
jgi:hypothetical protein